MMAGSFPAVRAPGQGSIRTLIFLLAVFLAIGAANASDDAPDGFPPGFAFERSEQQLMLAPGTRVLVRNGFGDVRARFGGSEGALELRNILQQFADEGAPLEVVHSLREGVLEIAVGFRDADGRLVERRVDGQLKRADLVLFVPEGAPMEVHTEDGFIQLRGLRSDVLARSQAGDIQIRSIRGDVDVATGRGEVLAALLALDRPGTQRITAGRGDVLLFLPEDGNFAIESVGDGLVSTEFSLRFERSKRGQRTALALVGKGTTPVRIDAGSGHVRLVRRPSPRLAAQPAEKGA